MGWISVENELPNEEDDVLMLVREIEHYGRYHEKREVYHWVYVGWCVDGEWASTYCHGSRKIKEENEKYPNCEHKVTHWMPLPKPPGQMTNADRIRAMTDEELSKFLCDFRTGSAGEHHCAGCKAEEYCRTGHNGMIEWLQQPAKED